VVLSRLATVYWGSRLGPQGVVPSVEDAGRERGPTTHLNLSGFLSLRRRFAPVVIFFNIASTRF
jgi:hypothetical protein